MRALHERMSLEHMLQNGYLLSAIEAHVRRWAIIKVLREEKGHHIRTAKRLGMHRNTLTRKMEELHIVSEKNGNHTLGVARGKRR